jgi:hypothetical protein
MTLNAEAVKGADESVALFVEGFERFIARNASREREDIVALLYKEVLATYDEEEVGRDRMLLLLTAAVYQLTEAKQTIAQVIDGNRRGVSL